MAIPTLKELRDGIVANLEAELAITIPVVGRAVLFAIASVQAAKLKLYWLAIADVQKNIFVDTADSETIGGTLERFGRVKLGRAPFAPTQGVYTVSVSGTIGAVIPIGTIFKSDDNALSPGLLFQLDVAKTLVSNPDTMELRALQAGVESRLAVGNALTATSPLLNVTDQVTVTIESTIPLNGEDLEDYRGAIVNAFQLESQGGAATDYRVWSADAQGVRFVYPYAASGECSTINLYVEANQADSTDGKGTPTAAILTSVEEVVEFDPDTTRPLTERGRRPVGAIVNFLAVTPMDVEIIIVNPINIDAATQTSITNSVTNHINDIRPFIDSADIESNRNDTLDINRVTAIIQNLLTPSQRFDSITMTVDGSPVVTSISFDEGNIPFLETITF